MINEQEIDKIISKFFVYYLYYLVHLKLSVITYLKILKIPINYVSLQILVQKYTILTE